MNRVPQNKLEETPTWAVAVVCFVLLTISIIIERGIEAIAEWLEKKHKKALHEALEKVKGELMLLGFISLFLTVFEDPISKICISKEVASTWHPCYPKKKGKPPEGYYDKCAKDGKVAFVSKYGIHQLHIFIFVLAIFHILQCIVTFAIARTRMAMWKAWEDKTKTEKHQYHNDERLRFARDTSFAQRHLNSWSQLPICLWMASFFRQFYGSVYEVDYMTLRRGFIKAYVPSKSEAEFDFYKDINESLEEDFKVVVGIHPIIWFFAVLTLLTYTNGCYGYFWLPFIPLIMILLVGTKLQMIITKMALRIVETETVVKGAPVVELGDHLFWFRRPLLLLYLIQLALFLNAFQLAFFAWSTFDNGVSINTCFHQKTEDIVIRLTIGVGIQVLCSYVTFPLYALVTRMRSSVKHGKEHEANAPISSGPATPTNGRSPVHHLRKQPGRSGRLLASPRAASNYENEQGHVEESSSPHSNHAKGHEETVQMQVMETRSIELPPAGLHPISAQHEISISSSEFSLKKPLTGSD